MTRVEERRDVFGLVPVSRGVEDVVDVVEQEGSDFFWAKLAQKFSIHSGVPERGSGAGAGAWSLTGLCSLTMRLK